MHAPSLAVTRWPSCRCRPGARCRRSSRRSQTLQRDELVDEEAHTPRELGQTRCREPNVEGEGDESHDAQHLFLQWRQRGAAERREPSR